MITLPVLSVLSVIEDAVGDAVPFGVSVKFWRRVVWRGFPSGS